MDGWLKKRRIRRVYNGVNTSDEILQSGGTSNMAVDKVSYRGIALGQ